MFAGMFVLGGLSCSALWAATSVARRYDADSRAESVTVASIAWVALVALPIYVLGYLGALTATMLAPLALLVHVAVIASCLPRGGRRRALLDDLRFGASLLRAPFDLVSIALRARSLAFFGIVAGAITLLYCALVSWHAPSFRHWDCLWYHEPIVALTIQNRGFAQTYVPDTLMRLHGYPRMGEMLSLWFVIFTDRRLVELPSVLGAALYVVATYALARRFGGSRPTAAAWSVGLLAIPAVVGELQSTMIDLTLGAFIAAMLVFVTHRTFRARDAIAVALAGFLVIHVKFLGVVPALSCALVAAVRLIAASTRVGRGRVALALGVGTVVLGAALGMTVVHNYVAFHSPFWPHQLEIKALHYKSAGWPERGPGGQEGLAEPWSVVASYLFGSPAGWMHGDVRDGITNYGLSVPWALLPAALLALPVALWQRARRAVRGGSRGPAAEAWDVVRLLSFPLACDLLASPATWAARYHFGTLAILIAFASAACASRYALAESFGAAFLLLGLMTRHWTPDILVTPERLSALAKVRYPRREVADSLGAPIVEATGLARERELGPGAVVVVSENYGNYPALLWNNHFSNRVLFVPSGPRFFDDAVALNPTWIFLGDSDPNRARAVAAGWQVVGDVSVSRWGKVYRRP